MVVALSGSQFARGGFGLLDPNECCVLFVDPEHGAPLDGEQIRVSDELIRAADNLSVPMFLSSLEIRSERGDDQKSTRADPVIRNMKRHQINPWHDGRLRKAIHKEGRTAIIIAGGWPEGSLIQCSLSAMADALDVYLLFDLSPDLSLSSPSAMRLIQAGAVPVTVDQLLLEWASVAEAIPIDRKSTDISS